MKNPTEYIQRDIDWDGPGECPIRYIGSTRDYPNSNQWHVEHSTPSSQEEKRYTKAEVLELMEMTRHAIQHHIPWVAKVMLEEYNKTK